MWPGPMLGTFTESVRSAFLIAENRLESAARNRVEIRPQTLTFEWQDLGGPQFAPLVPLAGTFVAASPGVQGLDSASVQRNPWNQRAGIATALTDKNALMGPQFPQGALHFLFRRLGIGRNLSMCRLSLCRS